MMPLHTSQTVNTYNTKNQNISASTNDFESFSRNIKRITNVPTGVIYSPFNNQDMVAQALGINTARVLNGKEPFPIICCPLKRDALKNAIKEFKEKELQGRLKEGRIYEKKLTSSIKQSGIKAVHSTFPVETKILGEYQTINRLSLVEPKNLPDRTLENIYVIGHGAAGLPRLYQTTQSEDGCRPISDVIKEITQLVGKKVKPDVKIKLTSCESADRETLQSFDQIGDISESKRGTEPLAKTAKTEANKHLPQSRVFGYHGLGVTRGSGYISQARCLESDFDKTVGKSHNWKKASTVREEF
ncbi:hypothetical protein GCM10007938_31590 [Vibrio zhanjiangensis]|uniref:Peptidase C80 domain-containing protein n=1 Tax=Vibrio zhanjiangensis TaxID=1046128 RepID=A0ABQ6F3V7_9VIBR|nr:hypothetical protein [Vibrio zhanjiangensis]GLT19377.1 hypothetical protein GCM10007938_31590 [Vibrio zhanjiangensis]